MTLNNLIQPHRIPVTEIVTKMREQSYFVDDSFQRKLVWTEKQKARLIETILINYPVPEVYLWEQGADAETGEVTYSIVDGQQRLTALQQFTSNEWPLKVAYLDDDNKEEHYAGKYWKDLGGEDKKKIWEYIFTVRTIPKSVTKEEIRAVFKRLNETDRSLNPQELRNAVFNGEFITAAEEIANDHFWRKWGIFSEPQIRRMGDIEFASSLLIFLREGIVTDSPRSINAMFDSYNDIYENRNEDLDEIKTFLKFLDTVLEKNTALTKMFTKANNIYSLFCVYITNKKNNTPLKDKINKLNDFVIAYENEKEHPAIKAYTEGVSSRTRSKSSREKRFYALEDWLSQ